MIKKQKNRGITLVALVVTIIVLLILTGVTMTTLLGENGIIKKAQEVADKMKEETEKEQQEIDDLIAELDSIMQGNGGSGTGSGKTDEGGTGSGGTGEGGSTKVADNIGTVISTTENTDLTDAYNNKITVPAGFHIVSTTEDSTVSYTYSGNGIPAVQDGIVVADSDGNQFVWVPVGTIKNDAEGNTTNTITLGRYSSFTANEAGSYTPVQTIDNYTETVTISSYYQELTTSSYGNTTANSLGEFLTKANAKGGYYLARYEASYRDGIKPYSRVSTGEPVSEYNEDRTGPATPITEGMLWNFITQPDAALVCRNMYTSNNYESDLVNSYAWDTAIIFIQTYSGNSTYASNSDGNGTLKNTGLTGDKVCNIYDMSGNTLEWTTETSSYSSAPYVRRGGICYYSGIYASFRLDSSASHSTSNVSFRPQLYVK